MFHSLAVRTNRLCDYARKMTGGGKRAKGDEGKDAWWEIRIVMVVQTVFKTMARELVLMILQVIIHY